MGSVKTTLYFIAAIPTYLYLALCEQRLTCTYLQRSRWDTPLIIWTLPAAYNNLRILLPVGSEHTECLPDPDGAV